MEGSNLLLIFALNKTLMKVTKYTELDSVGNDFLSIQDALLNGERSINTLAFTCQYNGYLVEYDLDGRVFITRLDASGNLPTEISYWSERTRTIDCTACNSEDDLFDLWNREIKPILKR